MELQQLYWLLRPAEPLGEERERWDRLRELIWGLIDLSSRHRYWLDWVLTAEEAELDQWRSGEHAASLVNNASIAPKRQEDMTVKTVTRYQSNDGNLWNTPGEADARDEVIRDTADATAPLGPRVDGPDFQDGRGYRQHDPEAVAAAKSRLIDLTRPRLAWLREREAGGLDMMTVPPSTFGRLLDGSCPPLENAWARLWAIDSLGREWSQPCYASHPDPGATTVSWEGRPA